MSFQIPEIPASIGPRADLYADVRALRLAMQKEVDEVQAFEGKLRESIINDLSSSDNTGAAGLRYRAQIVKKESVRVVDWGVIWSWARKNDRFDIFQKRLNERAAKDFIEAEGRTLPGTETMLIPEVSITKI